MTVDTFPDLPEFSDLLPVAAPFNLQVTVRLLQRRPVNRVERWEAGRYCRLMTTSGGLRLATVADEGSVERPRLRLTVYGGPVDEADRARIALTLRWILGLDAEPAPLGWLATEEPRLGAVAALLTGARAPCFANLWETCLSVLPFQQLSLDAGSAIHGRIIDRWGLSLEIGKQVWRAVPAPEVILTADPAALREAGLSRAKITAAQALARIALDGGLDAALYQPLPTEDARRELLKLPGIGPWSADVILLRGLRRLDLFPPGDTGSARGLTALLGLSELLTPAQASAYSARFGDRRAWLYFLSLGNQLIAKGLIDAGPESATR